MKFSDTRRRDDASAMPVMIWRTILHLCIFVIAPARAADLRKIVSS